MTTAWRLHQHAPHCCFTSPSSSIMPTQGFNIKSMQKDGFKLNVWDVGGMWAGMALFVCC